ncbi:chronophin isoform X2 [Ovis aries]|uniref:chronophin isoform X2 n=1 Tax=Ovis aries TaxID=9940 RepID=UPI00295291B2|nr:chronophin isoform X2 [Ovis aries]
MARCERLRGAALRDVVGRAQGVLFDCDGVLWNGECAVPGAPELLERLAQAGKAALFVSNNSRRARPELALRFARLGFGGLRSEQLFSSALCAARLLRQRLLGPPDTQGAVFVLGGEGLRAELRAAGLRLAGDPSEDPGAAPRVRAVLVGYDEHFSFAKLSEACAHLRDPDCLLVATDRDPWHPLSDGSRTPAFLQLPPCEGQKWGPVGQMRTLWLGESQVQSRTPTPNPSLPEPASMTPVIFSTRHRSEAPGVWLPPWR